jgi:hypothetical protein
MTDLSELAEKIKTEIASIKETGVKHAIEAGKLLKEAKGKVKHGDWMKWLSANCALSMRTARLYVQLADDPKVATDANLIGGLSMRQAAKGGSGSSPRRTSGSKNGGVPNYVEMLNTAWSSATKDQKRSFLNTNIDQVTSLLDERPEEAPAEQPAVQ